MHAKALRSGDRPERMANTNARQADGPNRALETITGANRESRAILIFGKPE
jgi:hypothetical protein